MFSFSLFGFGKAVPVVPSEHVDMSACTDRCRTAGQRFVYLDKELFNIDALFGTVDGRHPYVRGWVLHGVCDDTADAVVGHSTVLRTEMTAIGVEHAISHVLPFIKTNMSGNGVEAFLLLVQNTGYFPLGIFFQRDVEPSRQLSLEEAKERMASVHAVVILNTQ